MKPPPLRHLLLNLAKPQQNLIERHHLSILLQKKMSQAHLPFSVAGKVARLNAQKARVEPVPEVQLLWIRRLEKKSLAREA